MTRIRLLMRKMQAWKKLARHLRPVGENLFPFIEPVFTYVPCQPGSFYVDRDIFVDPPTDTLQSKTHFSLPSNFIPQMNIQTLSTAALHELRAKTKKQSDIEKIDEELQFRNDISYSPMTDIEVQITGCKQFSNYGRLVRMTPVYETGTRTLGELMESTNREIDKSLLDNICTTFRDEYHASLNQTSPDAVTLHQRFPANDVQNNALDAGESF